MPLHPLGSSTNFIDSLKQLVLSNGYELDFIKHFDPTYYLNTFSAYYGYVYTAFDNSKLITGFYNTYSESSFLNNLYTYDVTGFVQYFVDQNVSDYLVALDAYDPAQLYQMYQDAGGTPSTPPPGPGYMITYITGTWSNTQIATWITSNGGFSLVVYDIEPAQHFKTQNDDFQINHNLQKDTAGQDIHPDFSD